MPERGKSRFATVSSSYIRRGEGIGKFLTAGAPSRQKPGVFSAVLASFGASFVRRRGISRVRI
jgi:hypothetical protein